MHQVQERSSNNLKIVYLLKGSSGGKGVKAAGSVVGSQMTRNPASVDSQMNLALSVAENVMGGRSPTLRSGASQSPTLSQADECQAARGGERDLQEEKDHRTCYGLFILSRRGCRYRDSWEQKIIERHIF